MSATLTVLAGGGCIVDQALQPIANGRITFRATDAKDNPIPVTVKGGLQALNEDVTRAVVNGSMTGGPLTVSNPATSSPLNYRMRITIVDLSTNKTTVYTGVQISDNGGGTWNLSTMDAGATVQGIPVVQGPVGLSAYQVYQQNGGTLSETAWLASLQGVQGPALNFVGTYAAGTTYGMGQSVMYGSQLYVSLVDGNTGHQPDTSIAQWGTVLTFPAIYPLGRSRYASQTSFGDSHTAGCCAAPARLSSGIFDSAAMAAAYTALHGVSNGSFAVTINGTAYSITGIDFTGAGSFDDLTAIILAKLTAAVDGVRFQKFFLLPDHTQAQFVFDCGSSEATAAASSCGYFGAASSGTDISGTLRMTAAAGAVSRIADQAFVRYSTLVANALGVAENNQGVSGWTSYQLLGPIYAQNVSRAGRQAFIYAIGTNDNFIGGNGLSLDASVAPVFQRSIAAAIAWLTIPDDDKVRASTFAPGWSASTAQMWTFGRYASGAGTAATLYLSGDVIYLGYTIMQAAAGSFRVSIDDVDTGEVYSCAAPMNDAGTAYIPFSQGNTQSWAGQLLTVDCASSGIHKVTITIVSGNVYLDWAAGNDVLVGEDGPTLVMGGTLRQGRGSNYLDTSTGMCDLLVRRTVRSMRKAGQNVRFANIRATQGGMAINDYLNTDLTHMNQEGHQRAAMAYIDAFSFLSDAGVRVNGDDSTPPALVPLTGTSLSLAGGAYLQNSTGQDLAPGAGVGTDLSAGEVHADAGAGASDFGRLRLSAGGGVDVAVRAWLDLCGFGSNAIEFGIGANAYGFLDQQGAFHVTHLAPASMTGTVITVSEGDFSGFTSVDHEPYEVASVAGLGSDSGTALMTAGGETDPAARGWLTVHGYGASSRIKFGRGNVVLGTLSDSAVLELGYTGVPGGVILRSPDNTRYKLTVANGGTLAIAPA